MNPSGLSTSKGVGAAAAGPKYEHQGTVEVCSTYPEFVLTDVILY